MATTTTCSQAASLSPPIMICISIVASMVIICHRRDYDHDHHPHNRPPECRCRTRLHIWRTWQGDRFQVQPLTLMVTLMMMLMKMTPFRHIPIGYTGCPKNSDFQNAAGATVQILIYYWESVTYFSANILVCKGGWGQSEWPNKSELIPSLNRFVEKKPSTIWYLASIRLYWGCHGQM